jgi:membrane-associated phospholipid phosphatase
VKLDEGTRSISRRSFFGAAAATGAALGAEREDIQSADGTNKRARDAYRIRVDAARLERDVPEPDAVDNGDEARYSNRIGNYSKGLPHNDLGEADPYAYDLFTQAMHSGTQTALDQIPMGNPDPSTRLKLVNPCSGIAFDLQGADSHHMAMPPAPALASAQAGGEMVEAYWQALARDVPFSRYDSHATTQAAAADLSKLSDFRGPKVNGQVTTGTLFRGFTAGDLVGPYVSQFLLKPVPFGVQWVEQRIRTMLPGFDFLTQYSDWLSVQDGVAPASPTGYDPVRRYIRSGRDLAQWVHMDVLYQAYFNAMLIMLTPPDPTDDVTGGGMGVPLNPGNPYVNSTNQVGFGTFGQPAIAAAVAEIATRALKAVWYQKWFIHRRLRPEEYGGLVHNYLTKGQKYPIHGDVVNSAAIAQVQKQTGGFLLPMAFPEGCPVHPSYGAGHATVAGACVTILKAFFNESYVLPNPVVASDDGSTLAPYTGADAGQLTVGGELNKLAANVAVGRNIAGVHWRSDYVESLKLGEAVAISVLKDQKLTYGETFDGFTFTKLDGTKITV